jgi:hypothetical protein
MKVQRRVLGSALVVLATLVCLSNQVNAQRTGRSGGGTGTGINISKIRLGTEYSNGEVKGGYGNQVFRPTDHVILCVATISNPSADAKYKRTKYTRALEVLQATRQVLADQASWCPGKEEQSKSESLPHSTGQPPGSNTRHID